MVALSPNPEETVSATTLANCRPSPISHNSVPESTTGNIPGMTHASRTTTERQADEGCDKQELERQTSVQFLDHEGAVAGGDRRQAGHGYFVALVLRADLIQRFVEALNDGQKLAGIDVRDAA